MTNLKVTITEVPDPSLPDNIIAVIDGTPIVAAGKSKQEVWKELMISLAITIAHNSGLDYKELTYELKDSPYQGSAGVWRSAAKPPGITQWYVVKCEQRRFASLVYVDSKITLERVAKDIDVEIDLLEWLDDSAASPAGDGEAIEILKELCWLKSHKDNVGKDSVYEQRQPEAWKRANEFLNSLVKTGKP